MPAPGVAAFERGEAVEYFSESRKEWIPATVIRDTGRGSYDLDCKPNAPPARIRKIDSAAAPSVSARPSPHPSTSKPLPKQSGTPCHDAPVQLLRVVRNGDKWQYEVCAEGAQLLERYGSRRISVASICGLYRTGKSYLLNLLLERVQRGLPLFQVGSTTQACTEGLWLWGSVNSDDERSPLLAFIDCEGFGSTDSDRTRDAQLMTLCSLLSSALILNTRGALSENIFSALALTCRFAEHVEARGNEASRPELIWLLRDFQLDLVDQGGRPISPSEYLEQALRAAPTVGHDAQRGQAAHEVRQSLLRFFCQRRCATLVRPAIEEEDLQTLDKLPYGRLRKEFQEGVESLRSQLVAICNANPKTVGGQVLGCTAFVAMMRQLVSALNENTILNIRGAWEAVQHSACIDLTDELRNKVTTTMRKLATGQLSAGMVLPMTETSLSAVLTHSRNELKGLWDKRSIGDEAVRREYWKELEEVLDREERTVQDRNIQIADQQLTEACKAWLACFDGEGTVNAATADKAATAVVQLIARSPTAPLTRAAKQVLETTGRRVARERGAVRDMGARVADAEKQVAAASSAASQHKAAERAKLQENIAGLERAIQESQKALSNEQSKCVSKEDELKKAKAQAHSLTEDVELLRSLEHEVRAQLRSFTEREGSQRTELEQMAADVAKAEEERMAAERSFRIARLEAESSTTTQRQLQARLGEESKQTEQLEADWERISADHTAMQKEFEKLRHQQEASEGLLRKERDAERAELKQAREGLQTVSNKLQGLSKELQESREQLESSKAQVGAIKANDHEELRKLTNTHAEKEASWRENLEWVKAAAAKAETDRIASERAARKARWEADTALEERRWFEGEIRRLASGQR